MLRPIRCLNLLLAVLLLLTAGLLLIAGCSNRKTSDRSLRFISPVEAETVVQGKRSLLDVGPQAPGVWLDPRSRREFDAGHIAGAINIPYETLESAHRQLNGVKPIIVYGNGYNSAIAEAASKTLIELGHDDVRTLRGGLEAWREAGFVIATTDDDDNESAAAAATGGE